MRNNKLGEVFTSLFLLYLWEPINCTINMATLTFNKVGEVYQVDFTANADYALHIERESSGRFFIKQRTGSNGEYADCALPSNIGNGGKVMDYTFSHGVYPMNVRIISETPVTIAERQEAK